MSLKLFREEKLNKTIINSYTHPLKIEKEGIYLIEVTASAKAWWQKFKLKTSEDDELIVQVDGKIFDERSALWNGNTLKGLQKTVVLVVNLEKGSHSIKFLPKNKPHLFTIKVNQITDNKVLYLPQINNPAENGNRRSWYSLNFYNQKIENFSIIASASSTNRFAILPYLDDDDLQLKIDETIIKNEDKRTPLLHRKWYWCGRVLKGETKTYDHKQPLEFGNHFLEINADGCPKLDRIYLDINLPRDFQPISKRYPTKEDPMWTGDFNDDSEQILLARLIFGEARGEPDETKIWVAGVVLNRVKAKSWPDTIREVILKKPIQYDPFKEIDPNYNKIIDPLKDADKDTQIIWYRCYEIAEKMVSGKIQNPTEATHFHGKGTSREEFERKIVPNGRFLKKIGSTYFYWSPN